MFISRRKRLTVYRRGSNSAEDFSLLHNTTTSKPISHNELQTRFTRWSLVMSLVTDTKIRFTAVKIYDKVKNYFATISRSLILRLFFQNVIPCYFRIFQYIGRENHLFFCQRECMATALCDINTLTFKRQLHKLGTI